MKDAKEILNVKNVIDSSRETQLEKHKKTHDKFVCDEYDKQFKKDGNLEKHV